MSGRGESRQKPSSSEVQPNIQYSCPAVPSSPGLGVSPLPPRMSCQLVAVQASSVGEALRAQPARGDCHWLTHTAHYSVQYSLQVETVTG